MMGPNVRRLINLKIAADAIPPGGGVADGIKFLTSRQAILEGTRAATEWVQKAIPAVRAATGRNPWKTATDEEIAGELLRRVLAKEKGRK